MHLIKKLQRSFILFSHDLNLDLITTKYQELLFGTNNNLLSLEVIKKAIFMEIELSCLLDKSDFLACQSRIQVPIEFIFRN